MALRNPYRAYNQYKQNDIMLAPPEELTLMLYNGAIKFAHQGVAAIEAQEIEKAHVAITKTENIISELNATLNMEYDVSKGLRPLYLYISEQLIEANINKEQKILKDIIPLLTDLRDTWKEAIDISKKK